MFNNFTTWCVHYDSILYPYYLEFSTLFDEEHKPTYNQFLNYCYTNTKKYNKNGILTAYICPFT